MKQMVSKVFSLLLIACSIQSGSRLWRSSATVRTPHQQQPPANSAPLGSRLAFEDVASARGLNFKLEHSPTPSKFLIETMGGGSAFLDYNRDSILDVYLVNGAAILGPSKGFDKSEPRYWNRLFQGSSSGQFIDVTQKAGVQGRGYGMGIAVGDYDNNGYPDLVVTNYGSIELFHNRGDGTFVEVAVQAGVRSDGWCASAAFLDFDRDGDLDLYVTRYVDWSFENNPYCGRPQVREYCAPTAYKGVPDRLFRNNGNGTFADVSSTMGIDLKQGKGLGVAVEDVDSDGWPDIYVANDGVPCFLFRNLQGKRFEETGLLAGAALNQHGMPFAGMGVDIADANHDGRPDIFVTALSLEGFVLFENRGEGAFVDVSTQRGIMKPSYRLTGWGTKLADFDNDGYRDLLVVNGHFNDNVERMVRMLGTVSYAQPLLLLRNLGSTFQDASPRAGSIFGKTWIGRGAAFGDVNNDGRIDALVTHLGGQPLLLENRSENSGNRWIGFSLIGTTSNRDAIGAQIKVADSSGRSQYARVSTSGSYLSANDKRIIVGLGPNSVDRVTITWPSGRTMELPPGLALNTFHEIVEPKSS